MAEFWPGPLTLILPATARAVASLGQVVGEGTLGVRVPDHAVALAILGSVSHPVAASSANIRGEPPPIAGAEAEANLGHAADLVVDGVCEIGLGSSILDLTLPQPRLLREGSIPARRLLPWIPPLKRPQPPLPSPSGFLSKRSTCAWPRSLPVAAPAAAVRSARSSPAPT